MSNQNQLMLICNDFGHHSRGIAIKQFANHAEFLEEAKWQTSEKLILLTGKEIEVPAEITTLLADRKKREAQHAASERLRWKERKLKREAGELNYLNKLFDLDLKPIEDDDD